MAQPVSLVTTDDLPLGTSDNPLPTDEALYVAAAGISPLALSTTSARAAIPNKANGAAPRRVRVVSLATGYLKFGDGSVTATSSDFIVLASQSYVFRVPTDATHVACILLASTSTLHVTPLEN